MKSKVLTRGISKKVKIIIYLSSILILCFINPCSALAWSAGGLRSTIASIIVSMLMSSGAGVTNMDWLTQLNTAYGVESSIGTLETAISNGLLTESDGVLIDTGLSEAIMANSAYTDLGLDALFTTTASDATIQAGTVVASGGANIATEAIGAVTLGTVGQAFVAVGAGIGLGVLAHHFIERFGKPMTNAAPIDIDDSLLERMVAGGTYGYVYGRVDGRTISCQAFAPPGVHILRVNNGTYDKQIYAVNTDSSKKSVSRYVVNYSQNNELKQDTINAHSYTNVSYVSGSYAYDVFPSSPIYSTSDLSAIANGTVVLKNYSPDVIGSDGNQTGTYTDENGYVFPNLNPYYNPQEKGLQPIPMDEYMEFAQDAIDNTENGDVEEIQGHLFDNFINPYLQEQEPVVPEPDPDYTNPDVIPEQPDYTDKEPVSAEDVTEADAYTAPDLMERFPFCIPNDILAIFKKFKVGREAPYIEWNFKYDAIGLDYTFELDLSIYDDVAQILRLLELIGFVVGLGVATRKLIGA